MTSPPRPVPRASVIIATYNRRELLGRVLEALAQQSIPLDRFEVVVVDDGSSDGTADWVAAQRFPFALRLVRQENAGPAAARNAGIGAARGEILIFLDDDFVPGPQVVGEHLRGHAAERDVVVIGPASSLPFYREPWIAWQQATLERTYEQLARGELEPSFVEFWSGNSSARREDVLAIGGFDGSLRFNEDVEIGYRFLQRGLRFRFVPAARGLHHASHSFASWSRTHRSYGLLDVEILGRLGEGSLYQNLATSWQRRHPWTRRVVRWSAARRIRAAMAGLVLRACIGVGVLAPMSRFSRLACAAFANLLYWDAVAEALGDGPALFARLDGMSAAA